MSVLPKEIGDHGELIVQTNEQKMSLSSGEISLTSICTIIIRFHKRTPDLIQCPFSESLQRLSLFYQLTVSLSSRKRYSKNIYKAWYTFFK